MSFWWCDLPPSAHLYTSLYTTNGQPRWPFFYMQFPPFTFLSVQLWARGRRALLDCGGKVEVLSGRGRCSQSADCALCKLRGRPKTGAH